MTLPFERVEDNNTRQNFDQLGLKLQPILDGFRSGIGSPEGVVAAEPGTVYENKSGGAGTSFYVKESGSGNTGWVAPGSGGGGGPHQLLSATHNDTVAGSPTRGAFIVGNSTPTWAAFPGPFIGLGGNGYFLQHQGGAADPTWAIFDTAVKALTTASFPLQNMSGNISIYPFLRGGLITTMTALNAPTVLALGAAGTFLRSDGLDPNWNTIQTSDVQNFGEEVDDRVANLIIGGLNMTATYDDVLGTLTLDVDSTVSTHNFLSAQHGDTVTATAVRGDIVVAQGATDNWADGTDAGDLWGDGLSGDTWGPSTKWQKLALGVSGKYLRSDGSDALWGALTLADAVNQGTTTTVLHGNVAGAVSFGPIVSADITDGTIVNADINASAAIDATKIADGSVTSAEFQFINTLTSNAQTQLDGKQPLDTDLSEMAALANVRGDLLYTNSGPNWARLAVGTTGQYLGTDGTDVSWRAQSTLDHGSIGGLSDDDHAQYALLAGRSGGQTLIGGTGATDKFTVKPSSHASPTGNLELDLSASIGTSQAVNVLMPTTLTWAQTALEVAVGQTIAVNTAGGMRAFNVGGTWNVTGAPDGVPFLTFNFGPTVNFSSQASPLTDINTPRIFSHNPTYNLPQDTARALANMGATEATGGYRAFADVAGWAADAVGSTGTIVAYSSFESALLVGTGWTFTTLYGGRVRVPGGAGTITTLIGHQVDSLAGRGGTNIAYRSLGTADSVRFAGSQIVGATGAPNTVSGIDIAGDMSTRSFGVTLANGANNDVAIGNHSNIRITGPTGAFNITSLDTPYDGKIVRIVNTTAFAMTITNAAATGTAANRIVTSTNADLVGTAGNQTTVTVQYDSTTARWRETGWRP